MPWTRDPDPQIPISDLALSSFCSPPIHLSDGVLAVYGGGPLYRGRDTARRRRGRRLLPPWRRPSRFPEGEFFFFSPFVSFDLSMASFLVCSLDLVRYDLYDGIWFLPLLLLFIRCETIDFSFQIEN